jgi:hypothetical protein
MTEDEFKKIAQQRMLNFGQPTVGRYDDQETKKTHLITDSKNVPEIGQGIYRAFNIDLRISETAIQKQLLLAVKTKDGAIHPSPSREYRMHMDLFNDFLKTLPGVLRFMNKRPTMGNILEVIRGYDWNKVGWLEYKEKHKSLPKQKAFDREEGL